MKLLLLAALLVTGCATAPPTATDRFTGPYAGTWRSTRGSHRGKLECVLTKSPATHQYTARFHAHWSVFSSTYLVPLQAKETRAGLRLRGEKDLGALQGGLYRYEGLATGWRLDARYTSKFDDGTFTLTRVK